MRVLHLTGSPTSAFWCELSRTYAAGCLEATAGCEGLEPLIAWIDPDGHWRFPQALAPEAVAAAEPLTLPQALALIQGLGEVVVVPHLFCLAGMTDLRALLDVLGLPYVGNTAATMAAGADKAWSRAIVAAGGVAVPPGEVLAEGEEPGLALPVVVKPATADNSAGVSLVRDAGAMGAALAEAFRHGPRVLAERYVPVGREVRCGVLDLGDGPVALPLEEYRLRADEPIRGAHEKLAEDAGGALSLVAKGEARAWIVPENDPVTDVTQQAALRCHALLGCRDYGLFDFRIDPDGRPWFLEAGLYCSFAEGSVVATMARAAGWTTADLFAACVAAAARRGTSPPPRESETT